MEDSSSVKIRQIWKHKHSNEKIEIIAHVQQDIWDCKYAGEQNRTQITEGELLGDWKLLKREGKKKSILFN